MAYIAPIMSLNGAASKLAAGTGTDEDVEAPGAVMLLVWENIFWLSVKWWGRCERIDLPLGLW
jgi:hypothetical protein